VPSFVVSTEIVFGADDERLSIRHDAGRTATPYVGGVLLAVARVRDQVGLIRGLDRLLVA
jgi:4-hydroxy-tetrahydrodipicolinate reductase